MERIKPTRSELLKTRKRIKIATKGHELLKRKQDSLVMELFALLKHLKDEREALQEKYIAAQRRMSETRALTSDLVLSSAALAVKELGNITLTVKNIAGVKVPQLEQKSDRTFPIFESILVQELALSYQEVVKDILVLAARETAVRKIIVEIKKTKRRAHALEHIFIPKLEAARKQITGDLEERAREEFGRLKRRKK